MPHTGLSYGTEVAQKSVSPYEQLTTSVELLQRAHELLRELADRLVGNAPQQPAIVKSRDPSHGGMLAGMEEQASRIQDLGEGIIADVERITRRL